MRLLSANVKGDVLIAVDNVTTGVVIKDPKLSADEVVVTGDSSWVSSSAGFAR